MLENKSDTKMCEKTLATSTQNIREPFSHQNSSNEATWYFWPRASPRGPTSYYVVEVPETIYFFAWFRHILTYLTFWMFIDVFGKLFWTFWTFLDVLTFLYILDVFRHVYLDIFGCTGSWSDPNCTIWSFFGLGPLGGAQGQDRNAIWSFINAICVCVFGTPWYLG